MRYRIAAMSRSIRVWAFAACFAAFAVMALPRPAEADGPCGCGACMGPSGCVALYTQICYSNNVLMECEPSYSGCAALVTVGTCGS